MASGALRIDSKKHCSRRLMPLAFVILNFGKRRQFKVSLHSTSHASGIRYSNMAANGFEQWF